MRFILVGDARPKTDTCCCRCGKMIENEYLRDTRTRCVYCDVSCYSSSAISVLILSIRELARRLSSRSVKSNILPEGVIRSNLIRVPGSHIVSSDVMGSR
jgi:hypothetical protein